MKTSQHIMRLDEDPARDPLVVPSLHNGYNTWDAIVISDYDKGSVTEDTIEYVKKHYDGPIFVDTKKKDLARYEGMIVKINQKEFDDAISYPNEHLITTLGDLGASYKGNLYKTKQVEVYDVCGAGDTFFSALVYRYLQTKSIEESIIYANVASSVTVRHTGVYSPSLKEIEEAL
jgi:D-beta-D-heptose 7-phosphate kinase/D-beta-D-heptose 1-phosphate adenosyltransferase